MLFVLTHYSLGSLTTSVPGHQETRGWTEAAGCYTAYAQRLCVLTLVEDRPSIPGPRGASPPSVCLLTIWLAQGVEDM